MGHFWQVWGILRVLVCVWSELYISSSNKHTRYTPDVPVV